MASRNVNAFLEGKVESLKISGNLEVAQTWVHLEEFYTRKLWHQLTEALRKFIISDYFLSGGLLELYHNFLAEFELKINSLSLVEIVIIALRELSSCDEAVAFMEGIKDKVKHDAEAKVLCMVTIGRVKLQAQLLDDVKALIEDTNEQIELVNGITSVHSRYYELCSDYYKFKGDHAAYYREALRYLGCVDLQTMSIEEKANRAFCLAIAALVGEDVYNFGELLCQGVLEGLKATNQEWLVELLQAFNSGNLDKFDSLRSLWETQPDLVSNKEKLGAKIRLLCLMELVFRRHAHQRTIDFDTIATEARVEIKEVEYLVMKALSLGLVKGTIDEVEQQVNMTWVQPRVLDYAQVVSVRDKVSEWCQQIKNTIRMVEDGAPEIVAR